MNILNPIIHKILHHHFLKISRLTILAFLVLCMPFSLLAQSISLAEIVTVPAKDRPDVIVKATSAGGTMQFNRDYREGCVGNYFIEWKFSKDISKLAKGEKFSVTLNCLNCTSPCGYNWTSATVGGANNITRAIGKYKFVYNSNIKVSSSTGAAHNWSPENRIQKIKLTAHLNKKVPNTAFYITMGDHKVYYVYGEEKVKGATNCLSLLGLGKLVGSLELGAREGYEAEWMVATIGFALNKIKATNCLRSTYLEGLKTRITGASDTRIYFTEIQQYGLDLEKETTFSCAACGSCK